MTSTFLRLLKPWDWSVGTVFQGFILTRQIVFIGIAIFLAKYAVRIQEIGQFEYLQFLGYLLTFFWMDGFNKGYLAVAPRLQNQDLYKFRSDAGGILIWVTFAIAMVMVPGGFYIYKWFAGSEVPVTYWLSFAVFLFAGTPSLMVEHDCLVHQDKDGLWRWTALSHLGLFLLFCVPIWITGQLVHGLYGLGVMGLIRFLWFYQRIRPRIWPVRVNQHLVNWLKSSMPMMVYASLGGVVMMVDGWVIAGWYDDPAMFAIYRYGARELPFSMVLAGATATLILPLFAQDMHRNLGILKQNINRLIHPVFIIAIVAMLMGDWLFPKVFSPEFAPSAMIFKIYLFILISRFVITSSFFTANDRPWTLVYVGIIELIVNVIFSIWFVRYWGLAGVALATVIAFTVEKAIHLVLIYHFWKVRPTEYLNIHIILIYSIILVSAFIYSLM